MGRPEALSKQELYRRMDRFQDDATTPVSWAMLAELTGYNKDHLREVFVTKNKDITEVMQIRLTKALKQIENGDVTYMMNKDRSRFIKYNNQPKPQFVRSQRIAFDGNGFTVQLGVRNRHDYSQPNLTDELEK